MEAILDAIDSRLGRDLFEAEVRVSAEDGRAISLVERTAKVVSRKLSGSRMVFGIRAGKREIGILEKDRSLRLRLKP
jgi:hypothetical protein